MIGEQRCFSIKKALKFLLKAFQHLIAGHVVVFLILTGYNTVR